MGIGEFNAWLLTTQSLQEGMKLVSAPDGSQHVECR